MSVKKELLITDIATDLSQYDIVTPGGMTPPSEFIYDGLTVTVPEGYYDDIAKRGNIRSASLLVDVSDTDILSLIDDSIVPTPDSDNTETLELDQIKAVENHKLATVLSDRILDHIVEYLETDQAANNIVLAREKSQAVIDQLISLTENVEDIASFVSTQSDNFNQLLIILQTAFGPILGGAGAIPPLINLQTTYNAANIKTSAVKIQADMVEMKTKLEEIRKLLDNIKRDNSIAVI